ncbi:hypothetical protein ACYOEI_22070, partial [Singulisphaera rosea]
PLRRRRGGLAASIGLPPREGNRFGLTGARGIAHTMDPAILRRWPDLFLFGGSRENEVPSLTMVEIAVEREVDRASSRIPRMEIRAQSSRHEEIMTCFDLSVGWVLDNGCGFNHLQLTNRA